MRSHILAAIAAGSLLLSTTAVAAAGPSAPVLARDGAEVERGEGIVGTLALVGLIAVLVVVAVVVLLDDDGDEPTSP